MKKRGGGRPYAALALGAIGLLSIGIMYLEWKQGEQLKQELLGVKLQAALPSLPVILPDFTLPAEDSGYPEMLARPLFLANRRPPAVTIQGAVTMKKGQFILAGVSILPNLRIALLRDVATGKMERVEQGREVRGMLVSVVDAGRVILKQGEEEDILMLSVHVAKPVTPPQPAAHVQQMQTSPQPPGLPPATDAQQEHRPKFSPEELAVANRRRAMLGQPPLSP